MNQAASGYDVQVTGRPIPPPAHPGDAGRAIAAAEAVTLAPGERVTVATGTAIALPEGTVGFVVPRSGIAARHGITIVNAPGTVDAGYRGELRVTLLNTDTSNSYDVAVGDRIAQLVVLALPAVTFTSVDTLPASHRGVNGFGSTGVGGTA